VIVSAALEILGPGAREVVDALLRDLDDARRQLAHEPAVVGDEDQRALVGPEPLDEGLDRLEVQVVGRLVEHQHVRLLDHLACEDQTRGLATRQ
jgi:hypothetical protein